MVHNYKGIEDNRAFSWVANKMRSFCLERGFQEVHTQDRLSILAACEDPSTVAIYNYMGQVWLEYELLSQPNLPGVFCVSTSYRNEPNPVPGRHKLIFPMFEFEFPGNIDDLQAFETELLEYLGFGTRHDFHYKTYDELAKYYKKRDLTHEHENAMEHDFGPVVFCRDFPVYTSPFWNMRRKGTTHAHKIDVIMHGAETIGSAERSTDVDEMRREFYTISDGGYAAKLFELFGKKRVEAELNEFLDMEFFPRVGGGIGLTRMVDAAKKHGLVTGNRRLVSNRGPQQGNPLDVTVPVRLTAARVKQRQLHG
jgi:aspartyl/asparaginyl-tRNA synthetase